MGHRRNGYTAVLLIHGMGEQRPLQTMRGAMGAIVASFDGSNQRFHSRPTTVADSYEARRYIIPPVYDENDDDRRPQVEVFEYHWAHLMQGNQLADLWATVRRILLRWPWDVHDGLRVVWLLVWGIMAALLWTVAWGPLAERRAELNDVVAVITALVGTGIAGTVLTYVLTKVVPRTVTASFVDVVRYLDTSPRSLAVRTKIREGAIAHLSELNERYGRVVVVAHSLGSYIAYDAIRHLWGVGGLRTPGKREDDTEAEVPAGLDRLEEAAISLLDAGSDAVDEQVEDYQDAQRTLFEGLKDQGVEWRITDLVTLGSPMCMAHDLYTDGREDFDAAVDRQELPTCPPVEDEPPYSGSTGDDRRGRRLHYTYWSRWRRREVLSDAAPFAVVRWTNLWFPARFGFFGDWFAGPLQPLFGPGIRDVPIEAPSWTGRVPGYAHARYYDDVAAHPTSALAEVFKNALKLRFREEGEASSAQGDDDRTRDDTSATSAPSAPAAGAALDDPDPPSVIDAAAAVVPSGSHSASTEDAEAPRR